MFDWLETQVRNTVRTQVLWFTMCNIEIVLTNRSEKVCYVLLLMQCKECVYYC